MYEQPYNPYRNNVDIIKNYFKSPSVLVLGILNIVSIFLSVLGPILMKDYIKDVLSGISNYFDAHVLPENANQEAFRSLSDALHQLAANSDTVTLIGSISVVSILTVIGLFLIYFKSRSNDLNSSPSSGVTLLYVLAIFSLIGAILAVLALVLVTVLFFILYAQFGNNSGINAVIRVAGETISVNGTLLLVLAIVFAVITVITGFLLLFISINYVRYLGSIRNSMNTVELSRSGARPYGVFCVISAASTGMSLLTTVPALLLGNTNVIKDMGFSLPTDKPLPIIMILLTQAVSLAIVILKAKLALGYAKYIDDKKYGYSEPPASSGYEPVAAGVGSHSQSENPYSYLAQPKGDVSIKEATFVNPYADEGKTVSAQDLDEPKPVCPACGAEVDGSAPFCGNCGAKL